MKRERGASREADYSGIYSDDRKKRNAIGVHSENAHGAQVSKVYKKLTPNAT